MDKLTAYNPHTGEQQEFGTLDEFIEWHNSLGEWLLFTGEHVQERIISLGATDEQLEDFELAHGYYPAGS